MTDRRRTFSPVVLLGLASAGLCAVAGHREWVTWSARNEGDYSVLQLTGHDSATVPLAGALALVVLACWGVVLVTRGRFRRLVAALGLVAAGSMVVTAFVGLRSARHGLLAELARAGVDDVSTSVAPWFWAYLAGSVLALATAVLAVRWVPAWPEMGARYDAPVGAARRDQTDLDLWRALDEGRDPTLSERGTADP